jgi:serine/threonine protein kinase
MERLQALPDAADYFSLNTRRFVGNPERTLRAMLPAEAFKSFDLWVGQALAALAKLHEAGFLHGSIDPSALVINADGNLRLGGLQKVREDVGNAEENPGNPGNPGEFNPTNLFLPPEQNLYAAFRASIPFQRAYAALQQANWILDQLQTVFPSFNASRHHMFALYEKVQLSTDWANMQRASDVFMLGFALLTVYYELLEKWPYAASEEFYETKHEAFHDLIEEMTRFQPDQRIAAGDALRMWAPDAVNAPVQNTETNVASLVASPAVESVSQPALLSASAASQYDVLQKPLPNRRVLALHSHPEGRSKTRRSPRNSGPNPATGNP